MPPRATTAVRVRGAAQSPVAAEAAPTSRPARPRHAHFCVTLCHGSMVTPLASILGTCSTPKPHAVCACPASTSGPCAGASVPAAASAAPDGPPACSSPGSPFVKHSCIEQGEIMRILVVEDEKKLANFLKRGLEEELYAVDIALDGEDGWYMGQVEVV